MTGPCSPHQYTQRTGLAHITLSPYTWQRFVCETCGDERWMRLEDAGSRLMGGSDGET